MVFKRLWKHMERGKPIVAQEKKYQSFWDNKKISFKQFTWHCFKKDFVVLNCGYELASKMSVG